jgi:hypothetical protein
LKFHPSGAFYIELLFFYKDFAPLELKIISFYSSRGAKIFVGSKKNYQKAPEERN